MTLFVPFTGLENIRCVPILLVWEVSTVQSSFSSMVLCDLYCVLPAAKATRGQNQDAGCYRRSPRGAQTAKWGEICRQGTDRHWCSTQGEGHQSSWSPWKIPTSKILFTYHMPTFLLLFLRPMHCLWGGLPSPCLGQWEEQSPQAFELWTMP